MRAPIEAIPVSPGSSRKVEQNTTGASSRVFGASAEEPVAVVPPTAPVVATEQAVDMDAPRVD